MIKTDGKIVHDDISKDVPGAYPWQYKEYDIRSLIFMPIEPDINLYWNERAIFRKGYNVDNNTKEIYIPNFFIKINGKHKNDKEYIEFVRFLMESKNTLVINNKFDNNFPGYYLNLKNNEYSKSIKEYIENCKFIDKKKDIVEQFVEYYFEKEKRNNKFSSIVYDKQLQIKKILINTIKKNIEIWKANDLDNLLEVYFNIPESMAILINNFDYNYDIPKIVCLNVRFNKKDAYLINLLNELAFDIIILDVTGKTTIE